METTGWDTQVVRFRDEFCALRFGNPGPCADRTLFPMVHRKVYEVVGHFSLNAFIDGWMQKLSRGTGIERICPVRIAHKRNIGDATFLEASANTERVITSHWKSMEVKVQLTADLKRIHAYLDCHGVKLARIRRSPISIA